MTDLMSELISIIDSLEEELNKCRNIWDAIDKANPHFDTASDYNWQRKQARSWIYGTTELLESNELENWYIPSIPLSDLASTNARQAVQYWRKQLETKDAYYHDFINFAFPVLQDEKNETALPNQEEEREPDREERFFIKLLPGPASNIKYLRRYEALSNEEKRLPHQDETLITFLIRLAGNIEKNGWGTPLEERALKSFIGYVRQIRGGSAFLEHIFPEKMKVHYGTIIRHIEPEKYPIPENLACQVLMQITHKCRGGRKDARLTSIECLGLCWLCLTAARLKLPILIKNIHGIKSSALHLSEHKSMISIPTLFGPKDVPISRRIAQFLHVISCLPTKKQRETILQRPYKSLTRIFDEALLAIDPNPKFGNITYVSFTSLPHHCGDHRYQPK